jgi:DNA-directed RNA polymerase subunit RPC12/RpoP
MAPADTQTTHQTELLCHSCGGQTAYDPASQGLLCASCGTRRSLETDQDAAAQAEFPFDPDAPRQEPPETTGETVHHCQTCGGDVIFVGRGLSDRCPYCDGPVVLGQEGSAFETMALIPFRVPQEDAVGYVETWIKGRLAAPSDLARFAAAGRVAGLYAPFWTFDSQEAVDYWASYMTGSGKNRRRRHTRGALRVSFDDLLVPASPHVTPLIRDGILHDFSPRRLRPYRAGYLAGFAAERHHQSVAEGLAANASDKDLLIRNRIKRHVNRQGTQVTRYLTDTSGIHYRRILLPVWILHYSYGGAAKKVVVSGIDGRTYGERPFSRWKLAGYAALLSAVAIAVGLIWGAAAA